MDITWVQLGYESNLHMMADAVAMENDKAAAEAFFAHHHNMAFASWLCSLLWTAVGRNNTVFVQWMLNNDLLKKQLVNPQTGLINLPLKPTPQMVNTWLCPPQATTLVQRAIIGGHVDMLMILLPHTGVEPGLPPPAYLQVPGLACAVDYDEWICAHTLVQHGASWDNVDWSRARYIESQAKSKTRIAVFNNLRKRNCEAAARALRRVMRKKGVPRDLATHVALTMVWSTRFTSKGNWLSCFNCYDPAAKKKLKL